MSEATIVNGTAAVMAAAAEYVCAKEDHRENPYGPGLTERLERVRKSYEKLRDAVERMDLIIEKEYEERARATGERQPPGEEEGSE